MDEMSLCLGIAALFHQAGAQKTQKIGVIGMRMDRKIEMPFRTGKIAALEHPQGALERFSGVGVDLCHHQYASSFARVKPCCFLDTRRHYDLSLRAKTSCKIARTRMAHLALCRAVCVLDTVIHRNAGVIRFVILLCDHISPVRPAFRVVSGRSLELT